MLSNKQNNKKFHPKYVKFLGMKIRKFQYLFLSDSLIYRLINLSKSGETSLFSGPNWVLSVNVPFSLRQAHFTSSSTLFPYLVPNILKRGNFVIPLAPLKINIPMFARLSIHVPQIISISGNSRRTLVTTSA